MTFEGAIRAVGDIVPNTMDAICRMFPEIQQRSEGRARSKDVARTLSDLEKVKEVCKERGLSDKSTSDLCTAVAQLHLRGERFGNVLTFAAQSGPDVSMVDEVEPSWSEAFHRHAERAIDEEAQRTWAAVLVGEMERPGSVSKKTMSILDDMTKVEATAFRRMCDCTIEARVMGNETRLVSFVWLEDVEDLSLTRDEGESLDALGLTRIHIGGRYVYGGLPFQQDGTLEFSMGGKRYLLHKGESSPQISYPDFTRYGRELARVCGVGCDPRFQRDLLDWFECWGATVKEIE